jgi:acetylornithine deacetylase/succinyl-diaminopimelate desuccinylase-like protein
MDLKMSQAVIRTIEGARGPVVKLPTMGGSQSLEPIERLLGTHMIFISLANYDNNIHGADENLRVGNLWDGIEQAAALLLMDVNSAANK